MFTLGDVSDVLDSALHTGISIVDALSRLSDLADEGELVNNNQIELIKQSPVDYDENGNIIEPIMNSPSLKKEYLMKGSKIPDDSGVYSGNSTDTSKSSESSNYQADNSQKNRINCESSHSADSRYLSGHPKQKGKDVSGLSFEVDPQSSLHLPKEVLEDSLDGGLQRRGTYVIKLPRKLSKNEFVEEIPAVTALDDLCNVADDVLKYSRGDEVSDKDESYSRSESRNSGFVEILDKKVDDMLSSFQKLDDTVEKYKQQAMHSYAKSFISAEMNNQSTGFKEISPSETSSSNVILRKKRARTAMGRRSLHSAETKSMIKSDHVMSTRKASQHQYNCSESNDFTQPDKEISPYQINDNSYFKGTNLEINKDNENDGNKRNTYVLFQGKDSEKLTTMSEKHLLNSDSNIDNFSDSSASEKKLDYNYFTSPKRNMHRSSDSQYSHGILPIHGNSNSPCEFGEHDSELNVAEKGSHLESMQTGQLATHKPTNNSRRSYLFSDTEHLNDKGLSSADLEVDSLNPVKNLEVPFARNVWSEPEKMEMPADQDVSLNVISANGGFCDLEIKRGNKQASVSNTSEEVKVRSNIEWSPRGTYVLGKSKKPQCISDNKPRDDKNDDASMKNNMSNTFEDIENKTLNIPESPSRRQTYIVSAASQAINNGEENSKVLDFSSVTISNNKMSDKNRVKKNSVILDSSNIAKSSNSALLYVENIKNKERNSHVWDSLKVSSSDTTILDVNNDSEVFENQILGIPESPNRRQTYILSEVSKGIGDVNRNLYVSDPLQNCELTNRIESDSKNMHNVERNPYALESLRTKNTEGVNASIDFGPIENKVLEIPELPSRRETYIVSKGDKDKDTAKKSSPLFDPLNISKVCSVNNDIRLTNDSVIFSQHNCRNPSSIAINPIDFKQMSNNGNIQNEADVNLMATMDNSQYPDDIGNSIDKTKSNEDPTYKENYIDCIQKGICHINNIDIKHAANSFSVNSSCEDISSNVNDEFIDTFRIRSETSPLEMRNRNRKDGRVPYKINNFFDGETHADQNRGVDISADLSKNKSSIKSGSLINLSGSHYEAPQENTSHKVRRSLSEDRDVELENNIIKKLGTLQNLMSSSLTKLNDISDVHRKLSSSMKMNSCEMLSEDKSEEIVDKIEECVEHQPLAFVSNFPSLTVLNEPPSHYTVIEKDNVIILIDENEPEDEAPETSTPISLNPPVLNPPFTSLNDTYSCIASESLTEFNDGHIAETYSLHSSTSTLDDISDIEFGANDNDNVDNNVPLKYDKNNKSNYEKPRTLPVSGLFFQGGSRNEDFKELEETPRRNSVNRSETFVISPSTPRNLKRNSASVESSHVKPDVKTTQCGRLATHTKSSQPFSVKVTNKENGSNRVCFSPSNECSFNKKAKLPEKTKRGATGSAKNSPRSVRRKSEHAPVHTNFLRRKSESYGVAKRKESEDETLSIQLAALRLQLEEKRRKFDEEKKIKQEQWRQERAKNLQNAFFCMLNDEENNDDTRDMENNKQTSPAPLIQEEKVLHSKVAGDGRKSYESPKEFINRMKSKGKASGKGDMNSSPQNNDWFIDIKESKSYGGSKNKTSDVNSTSEDANKESEMIVTSISQAKETKKEPAVVSSQTLENNVSINTSMIQQPLESIEALEPSPVQISQVKETNEELKSIMVSKPLEITEILEPDIDVTSMTKYIKTDVEKDSKATQSQKSDDIMGSATTLTSQPQQLSVLDSDTSHSQVMSTILGANTIASNHQSSISEVAKVNDEAVISGGTGLEISCSVEQGNDDQSLSTMMMDFSPFKKPEIVHTKPVGFPTPDMAALLNTLGKDVQTSQAECKEMPTPATTSTNINHVIPEHVSRNSCVETGDEKHLPLLNTEDIPVAVINRRDNILEDVSSVRPPSIGDIVDDAAPIKIFTEDVDLPTRVKEEEHTSTPTVNPKNGDITYIVKEGNQENASLIQQTASECETVQKGEAMGQTENGAPVKVAPTSFTIGIDMMECPELTPQQKKGRERFLRNRQKRLEEEKEKKQAELEKKLRMEEKLAKERLEKERLQGGPNIPNVEALPAETNIAGYQTPETLVSHVLPATAPSKRSKRDVMTPRVTSRTPLASVNSVTPAEEFSPYNFGEYKGPAVYQKPSGKSNRKIIQNSIMHCCLCGEVNKESKKKCIDAINQSEANHFLVLFRDGLKFRSVYEYQPENSTITRIYGIGPKNINQKTVTKFYKYNSGGKEFYSLETKHLSIQVDGIMIKKELWEKKQSLQSKTDSNLKRFLGQPKVS